MRRRLALLVCAALAATSAALVPTAAHAVVVDGGTLSPDVTTTAVITNFDSVSYGITVPAGTRPTVTILGTPRAAEPAFLLRYANGDLGGSAGYFSSDPKTAFMRFAAATDGTQAQPGTLRVSAATAGDITFVLRFAPVTSRTVSPGEETTLAFTAGARTSLSFDATTGDTVEVVVTNDGLTSAFDLGDTPRLGISLRPQGATLASTTVNRYGPETVAGSGPQTLVVEPTSDLSGEVRLRVNITPAGVGRLDYGQPAVTATVEAVGDQPRFAFTVLGGADTLVQVRAPALQTTDGGPGSATVLLELAGAAPVELGTVTDATVTLRLPQPLEPGVLATLRVVGGPGTTGSLGLRVLLDPGPSTPVVLGAPTPVAVPADAVSARYSIDAEAGDRVELYLTDIAFGVPDTFTGKSAIEDPVGDVVSETFFGPGSSSSAFIATSAGTYTFVLSTSPASGLTANLLALLTTTARSDVTLPFEDVVRITEPAQNLDLRLVDVPVGARVVVTVADESGPDSPGVSAGLEGGTASGNGFASPGSPVFLESGPVPEGGVLHLLLDGTGTATGSFRVSAAVVPDVTGTLAGPATPTTVPLTRPGGVARYTFDGTEGDPFALWVTDLVTDQPSFFYFAEVSVLRPDGSVAASGTVFLQAPQWIELQGGLDATGRWTVLVDPSTDTTGSIVLTRVAPNVIENTIRPGAPFVAAFDRPGDVQRLTFTGVAGQRPFLDLADQTVQTTVRLVSPTGETITEQGVFGQYLELPVLTSSGTWALVIDPPEAVTGSLALTLGLATDPVRTVEPGQRVSVAFSRGQNPRLRIQVPTATHIALDLGAVVAEGTTVTANFLRPDGSLAASVPFSGNGEWVEMPGLTDTGGRWVVQLDPEGPAAGRVTLTARTAQDKVLSGKLGKTTNVEVKAPPQNVAFTFSGINAPAERQFISFQVTDSTFESLVVRLEGPQGTFDATVVGPGTTQGGFAIDPEYDGPLRIVLDPDQRQVGSARFFFARGDLF